VDLGARAADNLRYIRETIESARTFTAVPGWGGVGLGVIALVASVAASRQTEPRGWMMVWLGAAALGALIGLAAVARKARRLSASLSAAPARKFALNFAPPILAGALITVVLARNGMYGVMPAVWLLLYGVAIVTGGAFSVPCVPVMGFCILGFGVGAAFVPAEYGNLLLGTGFGVIQIGFGVWIAVRHGG